MQPIEKALFKVIDEGLDTNYVYPQGEYLDDFFKTGNEIVNKYFGQTPTKVKFGFGTKKELDIWLVNTTERYPLVWLLYPLSERSENNGEDIYYYDNAKIIFAINNTSDKLVNIRLQTTKFVLDQLANLFTTLMITSEYVSFLWMNLSKDKTQTFEPNFSYNENQNASGTVDVWDVIFYECSLAFVPDCTLKNNI
jgi:hypothetical protein